MGFSDPCDPCNPWSNRLLCVSVPLWFSAYSWANPQKNISLTPAPGVQFPRDHHSGRAIDLRPQPDLSGLRGDRENPRPPALLGLRHPPASPPACPPLPPPACLRGDQPRPGLLAHGADRGHGIPPARDVRDGRRRGGRPRTRLNAKPPAGRSRTGGAMAFLS